MEHPFALPFTDRPGRRERHLRRRHGNPLFAWPPYQVPPETLFAVQQADHEELESFRETFADLVRKAAELPADAGSEMVLGLKAELERHYEQACGLPTDQSRELAAIRHLIDVIMRTIRRHAGADPLAARELDDEQAARAFHFRLLEQPLVADLLHPRSPILPQELTPALLSATAPEVEAACGIFSARQLAAIIDEATALRERLQHLGLNLSNLERALGQVRTRLLQAERADKLR